MQDNDPQAAAQPGHILLDDFFDGVSRLEGVDTETARIVEQLYHGGKLTQEAILQGLRQLREQANG